MTDIVLNKDFKLVLPIMEVTKRYNAQGEEVMVVRGLASGTQIDLEHERMADTAIAAMQRSINEGIIDPQTGEWTQVPLRSEHSGRWDDVLGYITSASVDSQHNLWIEAELDDDNPQSVMLWKKLTGRTKSGRVVKLGLSVAGIVKAVAHEWNEALQKQILVYKDLALFETSVVGSPAYAPAYVEAMAKSITKKGTDWRLLELADDEGSLPIIGKADPSTLETFDPQDNDQFADGAERVVGKVEGHTPTTEMARTATRALEWRDEFNRGGTAVGVARARDIKNRKSLSLDTVGRMRSYFARHEVDKKATGFRQGEEGFPSAGRIAWDLWGGDAGKAWANKIMSSSEKTLVETEQAETVEKADATVDVVATDEVVKAQAETAAVEEKVEKDASVTADAPKTDTPEAVAKSDAETVEKADDTEAALVTASEDAAEIADAVEQPAERKLDIDSFFGEFKSLQAEVVAALEVLKARGLLTEAELAKARDGGASEGAVEKSVEAPVAEETVVKSDDADMVTTMKSAFADAIAPLVEANKAMLERIEVLESTPVDKSISVARPKHNEDEDVVTKFSREVAAERDPRKLLSQALNVHRDLDRL